MKRLSCSQRREKNWVVEGSEAHMYSVELVRNTRLKNDLKYVTDGINTTNVEVFNNVLLKYIPKRIGFEYDHMVMGYYIAALEHNFNSRRVRHDKVGYQCW